MHCRTERYHAELHLASRLIQCLIFESGCTSRERSIAALSESLMVETSVHVFSGCSKGQCAGRVGAAAAAHGPAPSAVGQKSPAGSLLRLNSSRLQGARELRGLVERMQRRLRECQRCRLWGRWRRCGGQRGGAPCRARYCTVACQAADWRLHRGGCAKAVLRS